MNYIPNLGLSKNYFRDIFLAREEMLLQRAEIFVDKPAGFDWMYNLCLNINCEAKGEDLFALG